MRTTTTRAGRTTNAILVYLVILVSLQIFLVSVAVEAFTTGDRSVAWASAAASIVLAAGAALFTRALQQ